MTTAEDIKTYFGLNKISALLKTLIYFITSLLMLSNAGAFNQPIIQYSNRTKNFVKELIRESGVNTQYQRDIERSLYHAAPLPAATNVSIVEGTSSSGIDDEGSSQSKKTPLLWHKKKSRKFIQKMIDDSPQDLFVPTPPRYDRTSKERCQDLMEHKGKLPIRASHDGTNEATIKDGVCNLSDFRVSQLIEEIEERISKLAKAEDGEGDSDETRAMTLSQIGLRMRDIEFLDQKKSQILREHFQRKILTEAIKSRNKK